MKRNQIHEAAAEILTAMGGNAEEICTGDCTTFAKRLWAKTGGVIVSNLDSAMQDELKGYPTTSTESKWSARLSHCWVKVDGINYDAFNTEGVDEEKALNFYQNNA